MKNYIGHMVWLLLLIVIFVIPLLTLSVFFARVYQSYTPEQTTVYEHTTTDTVKATYNCNIQNE